MAGSRERDLESAGTEQGDLDFVAPSGGEGGAARAAAGRLLGAPSFLTPWLDRFLEPEELTFALRLGQGALRLPEASARTGADPVFLNRLHRRGLVDLLTADGTVAGPGEEPRTLRLASFHARFEIWAIFEGWQDLPLEVREGLNEWELAAYQERKLPQIEALRRGEEPDPALENAEYLLLPEAEAVIDRVEHVYLWPCNCRAMMGLCNKPVVTCLRFENNRGLGWEISRERAKEVLREASRAGLMHTGELAREGKRVSGAICNCCGDCCYPHLVAERLSAQKIWPRSRYVALHLRDRCSRCGLCLRRCPFGAFALLSSESDGRPERMTEGEPVGQAGGAQSGEGQAGARRRAKPQLDPALCRGCGVCAVACPEEAIVMVSLNASAASLL